MTGPYPSAEPFDSGMLNMEDGHQIYWEASGDPDGKPAVVLHGGPGTGSSPYHRRLFDPARYLVILFDQRGCGRSTPHAGRPETDLACNTTWHLVADIERLREHLGIERWLVLGGSWGTALGLTYAQTHPERVTELVLRGVCTFRRLERDWYWGGSAGFLFPEAWQRFLAPVPDDRRGGDVVEAFAELLDDPDPQVRLRAVEAWDRWDQETAALRPVRRIEAPGDPFSSYAAARICVHYARHGAWLEDGILLRNATRLNGIPGVLVQGRYDVQTPARTAWELVQDWPDAKLVIVDDAGHTALDPGIARELMRATNRFSKRR